MCHYSNAHEGSASPRQMNVNGVISLVFYGLPRDFQSNDSNAINLLNEAFAETQNSIVLLRLTCYLRDTVRNPEIRARLSEITSLLIEEPGRALHPDSVATLSIWIDELVHLDNYGHYDLP